MYNMTFLIVLRRKCQQFQSRDEWKLGYALYVFTFFWHRTSKKRKNSRFFKFWKKRKKRILELCCHVDDEQSFSEI